jgi:vancomycin resistance protein VanJ
VYLPFVAWGYLAAMCIAAFILWEYGDVWWPATVLLFIGRWLLLVPVVMLAVVALVVRRSSLVPLVITASLVAGPIMGFRTGWRRLTSHPAGMHVRVMTLNGDGDELDLTRLHALFLLWRPDIVAIQECNEPAQEQFRKMSGWFYHSARAQCLVSRYPILDSAVMNRSALERVHGDKDNTIGGSGDVVRYTLLTPQGQVNVTNVHLETPRKGLEGLSGGSAGMLRLRENTQLRAIESDLARRWVNGGTAPTLVVGDFNTPIESQIFQNSWGDLTDAFSRAGWGLGMTKYNGWIRVRIDHVLTGPGWYADRAVVGPDVNSDHRPLMVDLTLVPPGR